MILLIAFILGFGIGWFRATKRGGQTMDKLQYGVGHGLALMIAALFVTLILDQAGVV
ncbi:MAG TPA: hypothetical protein VLA51_03975 [Paracoccaceae bacterium]|nr:hypothetical protein [Paracoccaceae bacterium]